MERSTTQLNFSIITVSDSCFENTNTDKSGVYLKEAIESSKLINAKVINYKIVPDEFDQIRQTISSLSETTSNVDVILTSGGTGFSKRDVTPEATKSVLDKEAIGLVVALLNRSLDATPMAALSRLSAGIKNQTLIVNFPGSQKAVKECWEVLEPLINHSVNLLRENKPAVTEVHFKMQHHSCDHHHELTESRVNVSNPASRPRESPYPIITVDQAMQILSDESIFIGDRVDEVDLLESLGCVLAEDVHAKDPQPPFPASIKDGYAVLVSDGTGLRQVMGSSVAGSGDDQKPVTAGFCMRISTGAPIPLGADAVVQVEDTELIEAKNGEEMVVKIIVAPKLGQDIRDIGSDVAQDELVLRKGTVISSAEIGILGSVGKVKVNVYKKPSVTVMSTGNELVEPNVQNLPYGKIRDSNRLQLITLIKEHGFNPLDGGCAIDEPQSLLASIRNALTKSDILVTSGGVSMGEKDLLKQVLGEDLGFQIHFARVLMKPGKPTTFATGIINGVKKYVFGLPGNPVSAWVTAQLYVIPTLKVLSGFSKSAPTQIKVKMLDEFKLDPRPEYCRAIAVVNPDPFDICASVTGFNQMSSRLTSNKEANLLLKLPPKSAERPILCKNDIVDALLIKSL